MMGRTFAVAGGLGLVVAAPLVAAVLPESSGASPETTTAAPMVRPIPIRQVAATTSLAAGSKAGSRGGSKAGRRASLRLSVRAPAKARKGGVYTYTVRVSNHGPATPSAVIVRNLLPKGVLRTGAHLPNGVGGQADGRFGEFIVYKLRPGQSVTMRLTVKAKRAGRLHDRARVTFVEGARSAMPKARTVTVVR